MLNHFGAWAALIFKKQVFLCELPWPKYAWNTTAARTQCLTICFTSGVRPPWGNVSIYLHFKKKKKRKEQKPMLWFKISQLQAKFLHCTLQAPTCFLAFRQHSFYPQNEATSGCLAAKWHHCLQQGLAQALGLPQDHHAGCANCPGVLCHPWAGTLRMCLYEHNTRPCSACVSLCSMSHSSTVMPLSPFKARLIAFKTEVPSQKDQPSHLAVQRSLAIGAATGLGKTGNKKSVVNEKY